MREKLHEKGRGKQKRVTKQEKREREIIREIENQIKTGEAEETMRERIKKRLEK